MNKKGKTKLGKGITLLALISLLTLINGCIGERQESPVKLGLTVSPLEGTDGEQLAQVILTVQSETDMQNVSGEITLENGLELVEGDLQWQTSLEANQPKTFNITVKTPEKGTHEITATAANTLTSAKVPAERVTFTGPSEVIQYTEEEWIAREKARRNKQGWLDEHFLICNIECSTPEPLKGEELNSYFKSLSLKEDPIYVIIQFELPDLQASPGHLQEYLAQQETERSKILEDNKVVLLGAGGKAAQYAKVPKAFLEEKHYDFIRWVGIKSPEGKMDKTLRDKLWYKNCTGSIKFDIMTHGRLTDKQLEEFKQLANGDILEYNEGYNSFLIEADAGKIKEIASLGFVREIGVYVPMSICDPGDISCGGDPFAGVTCSD